MIDNEKIPCTKCGKLILSDEGWFRLSFRGHVLVCRDSPGCHKRVVRSSYGQTIGQSQRYHHG